MHQAEITVLCLRRWRVLSCSHARLRYRIQIVPVLSGLALSFIPRLPEVKLNPEIVFYFFPASAALSGGAVHVVAQFPPKLAADSSARDRIGAGDDRHDCMDRAYDCPGTPRAAAFALVQLFGRQMPLRLLQSSAGLAFRIASKQFSMEKVW